MEFTAENTSPTRHGNILEPSVLHSNHTQSMVASTPHTLQFKTLQLLANRKASVSKVAQLKNQLTQLAKGDGIHSYDAGAGGGWHIHHGNHIKYSPTGSRLNFNAMNAKQIRKKLGEMINNNNLEHTLDPNFRDCLDWINKYK